MLAGKAFTRRVPDKRTPKGHNRRPCLAPGQVDEPARAALAVVLVGVLGVAVNTTVAAEVPEVLKIGQLGVVVANRDGVVDPGQRPEGGAERGKVGVSGDSKVVGRAQNLEARAERGDPIVSKDAEPPPDHGDPGVDQLALKFAVQILKITVGIQGVTPKHIEDAVTNDESSRPLPQPLALSPIATGANRGVTGRTHLDTDTGPGTTVGIIVSAAEQVRVVGAPHAGRAAGAVITVLKTARNAHRGEPQDEPQDNLFTRLRTASSR